MRLPRLELTAQGVEFLGETTRLSSVRLQAHFKDPDGNVLILHVVAYEDRADAQSALLTRSIARAPGRHRPRQQAVQLLAFGRRRG